MSPVPSPAILGQVASSTYKFVGPTPTPFPTITSLRWLVHPDDATDIISGEINSLICRQSGLTFLANAATNRMPLNTTERPGHKVAQGITTNGDFLRLNDATIAASIQASSYSFFSFTKLTSGVGVGHRAQHSVGTTFGASGHRIEFRHDSSNMSLLHTGTTTGNYFSIPASSTSTDWALYISTYDSNTGTATHYLNNVTQGSRTLAAQTMTGFLNVLYGGGIGYHSIAGAKVGVMTLTERTNLWNWVSNTANV